MANEHLKISEHASSSPAHDPETTSDLNDDLIWDGERYIPGMSAQIEVEHMHRYLIARKLAAGLHVLDIACGEGYGSYALSRTAASVVGVDISDDAIRHAQSAYGDKANNLTFVVGSAADIPLADASVDLVVSFETIEHHDQHEAMMREIKRVLRPDGLVIISSPNKYEYSDVSGYSNPWHVKELYLNEFESLLRAQFSQVALYGQRVITGSVLAALELREAPMRTLQPNDTTGDEEQAGIARPLYFVALASDGKLPSLDVTMYEVADVPGEEISKTQGGRVECKVYWQTDADESWSERHSMGSYVLGDGKERVARLELREPATDLNVRKLRVDVTDRPGVVNLSDVELIDSNGHVLWSWCSDQIGKPDVSGAFVLEGDWPIKLIVPGDDPWFELPVPDQVLKKLTNGCALTLRLSVHADVAAIAELAIRSDERLKELETHVRELAQASGDGRTSSEMAGGYVGDRTEIDDVLKTLADMKNRFETERAVRERLETELDEKEKFAAALSENVLGLERERERISNEHHRAVGELLRRGELLRVAVAEADARVRQRDEDVRQRDEHLRQRDEYINALLASTSWRITKPLRFAKRLTAGGAERAAAIRSAGKVLYRRLPVPHFFKRKVKGLFFKLFPGVFAHTRAYRDWAALRSRLRGEVVAVQIQDHDMAASASSLTESEPKADEVNLASQLLPVTAVSPSQDYQSFPPTAPRSVAVKAIAFYLPQFHPFPENDEWWGRGFTEWTNVTRAVPQFAGHYQPHLPGELGFYDLRIPDVQRRQVELAKAAGLGGFCFYFYWFGGKRLMEAPIRQYLEHREFDLPFCLCWANENWTRRWDGLDQELLISQHHSPEDDLAFIEHVAQYMRDPRYIRVDGRPLLLVYRPNLLPDALATVERWRKWARANDLGELYLAYTQSFERVDPREYGFDAAIEFPPNNSQPPSKADSVTLINESYAGHILDWTHYVERSRSYQDAEYRLFRGVTPSWDNEARKPGRGTVFVGSTPKLYEEWLCNAATDTVRRIANPDERLVFINAWNEWAEGAHLEPDRRYGYAWLQATNNALSRASAAGSVRRVLVVSHDAYAHGAQLLALNLVKTLAVDFGVEVETVLLGEGPLKSEFERWGAVHDLAGIDPEGEVAKALTGRLVQRGFCAAICNTTVSGLFAGTLSRAGVNCVALVHELQGMLTKYGLQRHAAEISQHAKSVVFPAEMVQRSFTQFSALDKQQTHVRPQGLYKRNQMRGDIARARSALRERLHLPGDAKIVLGVGYADFRKGVDLYAQVAAGLADRKDTYFVWVGHWESAAKAAADEIVLKSGLHNKVVFTGLDVDTDLYYAGADVLALTSREDPFPSVVLEALEVGVPVVAFDGASGSCELLKRGGGLVVPFENVGAFAEALRALLESPKLAQDLGSKGARIIADEFSFRHYVFDLLDMLNCGFKRVSVVVPSYNYERYIGERLDSVLKQTYPIYELIVLDDNSSDGSVRVIREHLANQSVDNRLLVNSVNSGSVFAQWKRGVEFAKGDFVWIAEADDLSHPEFLATVVSGFDDERTVLSYCESKQMAETGEIICEHYRDYVADISSEKWTKAYIDDGKREISDALAVKNTIPNVSAVVFRRAILKDVLERHFDDIRQFRVAGDWMVYLRVIDRGRVAFVPDSLNLHRRHAASVTIGGDAEALLKEIRTVQLWVRRHHMVDPSIVEIADRYALELCSQFDVDTRVIEEINK
ncbi:glycoside hydrolase family 99-like domain-containing protein [Burkholderia multivorans]|uniref:glycoside hydrolase family 99-like domain-containing protein n=1 Tax=Burkholderia multivorans TaxID=87883 RepID=UPI002019231F|nr:glycoside hydrolase family 99-like domain-containing protein [Burkholderia multivorans]MCO1360003.1 glycoside hydrolase family 99-like domain-containing protein [Burkholderia multivorans]MCO1419768.1 glycoside hydrolase family 99-like domain-containing protein [Burkholderia multivorans]UQO95333.1 glycoside hydrolase family 99-like domain-containing protein [Burkholderia multivorans]